MIGQQGRRIAHERIAVRACRQRRARLGLMPAQWALDAWRQRQRIARNVQAREVGPNI